MVVAGTIIGILISNQFNHMNERNYDGDAQDIRHDESDYGSEEILKNISIPCWDTLIMEADSAEQEVNFYNPEKNKNCDFQLTLSLEDGTELWKSQLIQNGKAIYNIILNQPLEAGTYKAMMKYDCFSRKGVPLNGSILNFNLIVEKSTEDNHD